MQTLGREQVSDTGSTLFGGGWGDAPALYLYRGERQPEGQSKKRAAFGAYTGGRVPAVPVFESKVEEPLVLKPGPGVSTKRKPQPKPPHAEPVEPTSSFEVHETQNHLDLGVFELAHQQLTPAALEPTPVKNEQGTEPKDPKWKEVRGRRLNRPRGTPTTEATDAQESQGIPETMGFMV